MGTVRRRKRQERILYSKTPTVSRINPKDAAIVQCPKFHSFRGPKHNKLTALILLLSLCIFGIQQAAHHGGPLAVRRRAARPFCNDFTRFLAICVLCSLYNGRRKGDGIRMKLSTFSLSNIVSSPKAPKCQQKPPALGSPKGRRFLLFFRGCFHPLLQKAYSSRFLRFSTTAAPRAATGRATTHRVTPVSPVAGVALPPLPLSPGLSV